MIHAFIECRLPVDALAAIPANQPPYAANAKLDSAEATIKEARVLPIHPFPWEGPLTQLCLRLLSLLSSIPWTVSIPLCL